MAGPTTEAVNEDVKALREDLHRAEVSLRGELARVETSLVTQIGEVKADLREVSTQLKGILTTVKILAVLAITSIAASTWWAATITGEVRHLSAEVSESRKMFDGLRMVRETSVKGSTVDAPPLVNPPLEKRQ